MTFAPARARLSGGGLLMRVAGLTREGALSTSGAGILRECGGSGPSYARWPKSFNAEGLESALAAHQARLEEPLGQPSAVVEIPHALW